METSGTIAIEKSAATTRAPYPELMVATVMTSLLALALPVMTLQVYDRILPNAATGTLAVLVAGVAVAVVLEVLFRIWRAWLLGWAGARFEYDLSGRMMRRLLDANLSKQGSFSIGDYLGRMAAISRLKDFSNGYVMTVWVELAMVPVFLLLIAYISGPLVAAPVTVLMVFVAVMFGKGHDIRQSLNARDVADSRRYDFLVESIEGVHGIKSFSAEQLFTRRYEALEEKSAAANLDVMNSVSGGNNTVMLFSHLMLVAVIFTGALFVIEGGMTTGALVATILLSGRIMQPVQRAIGLWMRHQDRTLAREKVISTLEIPAYMSINNPLPNTHIHSGLLSMKSVTLNIPGRDTPLLDDINVDIRRGDFICISADDRAAAQAVFEVASGLYPPTAGEITVNGRSIGEYEMQALRENIGYVDADSVIFRGTIRDNMGCFGLIPEKYTRSLAAMLELDRDIAALPSGYDTFLTGGGFDMIPPVLRQKICIVRALAYRPRILLLDNPDRRLDRRAYAQLFGLLARLKDKVAVMIVTDDKNLRSLATATLVIRQGKAVWQHPSEFTKENKNSA